MAAQQRLSLVVPPVHVTSPVVNPGSIRPKLHPNVELRPIPPVSITPSPKTTSPLVDPAAIVACGLYGYGSLTALTFRVPKVHVTPSLVSLWPLQP